jgi:hypothetical protein
MNVNIPKPPLTYTISLSPAIGRHSFGFFRDSVILQKISDYKERIYDLNFTCHLEPFTSDAHGVYISEEENRMHIRDMVYIQEKTGISVSPVFNNIYVPNDKNTLKLFVKNFARLYDLGIRRVTIPHIFWMHMGDFQREYKDVVIKNTVLRRVKTGQEFWLQAEAGFDYVNLDTPLVRDFTRLKEIRRAQISYYERTGKYVKTSLLTGLGCHGTCPFFDEHHQHTLTNPEIGHDPLKSLEIFRYPQEFSCNCSANREQLLLMGISLPYFRNDFMEAAQYFDVIKLPGRHAFQSLSVSLMTISALEFSEEKYILDPPAIVKWADDNPDIAGQALNQWRKKTINCRYQCWDCGTCTTLASLYLTHVESVIPESAKSPKAS